MVRGSRVLVTGGSGLLGSHVCDCLIEEGAGEVLVLDNFLRGRRNNLDEAIARSAVQVREGSVTDAALMRQLMDGVDYVCHLAALRVPQCTREPDECFEVMVDATYAVLQAAARAGVKKLVYASSVAAYGEPDYLPIDERHPLNGGSMYGAAKATGEQFCRAWRHTAGLRYLTLRYFNMYGPRMSLEGEDTEVIIKWLDRLEAGEAPVVHGDGSASIDWIHVRDAARATVLALGSPVEDEAINIASGQETTLKQLLELLIELTGSRASPRYEAPRTVYGGARRVGSPEKAKRLLGFEARIGLREGLQDLLHWYRRVKREAPAGA